MTATAADALRMLAPDTPEQWPAGILAAADLRQARAEAAAPGPYRIIEETRAPDMKMRYLRTPQGVVGWVGRSPAAEHIAAEANPAHALAAVRHWRGVVERHGRVIERHGPGATNASHGGRWCGYCHDLGMAYPCRDLSEVSDEARAYLGGAT